MHDRRRVVRLKVDWPVKVESDGKKLDGRALEFSEHGILVGPWNIASERQRCELSFALPGQSRTVQIRARAIYTTPRGVALRFERPSGELVAEFRRYVEAAAMAS